MVEVDSLTVIRGVMDNCVGLLALFSQTIGWFDQEVRCGC